MNKEQLRQEREQWHKAANTKVARLAIALSELFTEGYDAEQTDVWWALQNEYLMLQCEIAEHDRSMYPRRPDHLIG